MLPTKPDRLERFRRRYADFRTGWVPATALYQQWITERLAKEDRNDVKSHGDDRILDLGCGRGGIVERLGDRGNWIGSDPDIASLREHRLPTLVRCCALSEQLPFETGQFDLVTSSWVLEHVTAPEATFSEIARILRPGGSFIFLTPNAKHPLPRLSKGLARMNRIQRRIVTRVYGRTAEDTFPVAYQANTHADIAQHAIHAGLYLKRLRWIEDPSYFSWNSTTFRIAVGFCSLLPTTWKVHLVGELIRA